MAYDKENRRLYVDESSDKGGIALWQIADCLRYYKRDKNGRRNIGTIIENAEISVHSVMKPYRSTEGVGTTATRKAANYGWDTKNKATSETTTAFLDKLKANGAGNVYWDYLRPRKENGERFRALDFNGYNHLAKPYGTPLTVQMLTANAIPSLSGASNEFTLGANKVSTGSISSGTFTMLGLVHISARLAKITPADTTNYTWYVDGSFDVSVVDSTGKVLIGESFFVTDGGNGVPETRVDFEVPSTALKSGTAPYHIEYSWNIENRSYQYVNNEEYFDINMVVKTDSAYTLARGTSGKQGIYVNPYLYGEDWEFDLGTGLADRTARDVVFDGNGLKVMAVIELTDGSTTERRIVDLYRMKDIVFSQVGFSSAMISGYTNAYLYLFTGDEYKVFNFDENNTNNPYGAITLADAYELTPFPIPYYDVAALLENKVFAVFADDFQSLKFEFSGGTTEIATNLTKDGVEVSTDDDVDAVTLSQYIRIENAPLGSNATMIMAVYSEGVELGSASQSITLDSSNGSYLFQIRVVPNEALRAWDMTFRVTIKTNGMTLYLNPYTQRITSEESALFPLGTEA